MASVRHLGLFPPPCLDQGSAPENYHAQNISLQAAMNLAWRVQKIRVNFTGRIKTLFTAFACDNETVVEQYVSHEIDAEFFLYLRGDSSLTESNIVCGDIFYSGQESGPEPRSSLSLTIHSDPSLIHQSGGSYAVPMFVGGGFLPIDRKQKPNLEYAGITVNSPDRAQLILPLPEGSGWYSGSTTINVLADSHQIEFAFAWNDPESERPSPISCVDPESGPFESQFERGGVLGEIDTFTLTPFYWPYDPGDGDGPIYDSATGAQLRAFPD